MLPTFNVDATLLRVLWLSMNRSCGDWLIHSRHIRRIFSKWDDLLALAPKYLRAPEIGLLNGCHQARRSSN